MAESFEKEKQLQREMNVETISCLNEKGCDMGNPRYIECVFYSSDILATQKANELLVKQGFEIRDMSSEERPGSSPRWCLEARMFLPPDLESLNDMTDRCIDIAFSADSEFDGWYTEI